MSERGEVLVYGAKTQDGERIIELKIMRSMESISVFLTPDDAMKLNEAIRMAVADIAFGRGELGELEN